MTTHGASSDFQVMDTGSCNENFKATRYGMHLGKEGGVTLLQPVGHDLKGLDLKKP